MAERAHPEHPGFQGRKNVYRQNMIKRYLFCKDFINGKIVLDIPCGVGWGTALLKKAKKVYGVDVAPDAIEYASRNFKRENFDYRVGDMRNIPFPGGMFDVVTCLEGYEHVERETSVKFIAEAKRVLKPGGIIIMTTPLTTDGKHSGNPYHLYEPTLEEFKGLMDRNFETVLFETFDGPEGKVVRFVGKNSKEVSQSAEAKIIVDGVNSFVESMSTGKPGEYAMCGGGETTLYTSCFAAMVFHYTGRLAKLSSEEKAAWVNYINSWQDKNTGLYLGPEIVKDELTSQKHDYDHITMHLTAHVLPALSLLGGRPAHPLNFAHRFLDKDELLAWLEARDWKDAWLEGNNLIFIGQFLIYLRDFEGKKETAEALNLYFDWLDAQIDPGTGLWGTNGYCSPFVAMCGGYHQLLVYYHEERKVKSQEKLIDTVLSLQHKDGGFSPSGGGGACEDVDAVDILVNLYKQLDYRRDDIRQALQRALPNILRNQMPDGGFVYKLNQPFIHMGILKTQAQANEANMFATWFRTHTLALIGEILIDEPQVQFDWQFNNTCSMGWHKKWDRECARLAEANLNEKKQVRGNVDTLNLDLIRGWACVTCDARPVEVEVTMNGNHLAKATAQKFREDLKIVREDACLAFEMTLNIEKMGLRKYLPRHIELIVSIPKYGIVLNNGKACFTSDRTDELAQ